MNCAPVISAVTFTVAFAAPLVMVKSLLAKLSMPLTVSVAVAAPLVIKKVPPVKLRSPVIVTDLATAPVVSAIAFDMINTFPLTCKILF